MVDEAGDVAADGGVADVEPIELEAPDVPLLQVFPLALEALAVGDLLAGVVDDPRVLRDRLGRKNPSAGYGRTAFFDQVLKITKSHIALARKRQRQHRVDA